MTMIPSAESPPEDARDGWVGLWTNLRATPRRFREAVFRGGPPTTDRSRSSFVFGNVFLHVHSVRTHRWSLKWVTTCGLGIAADRTIVFGD